MKIFYSFITSFIVMFLGMIGFQANAQSYTFTLNIDNPDNVTLQTNTHATVPLATGDNVLTLDATITGYELSAKSGNLIANCTAVDASGQSFYLYWTSTTVYLQNYSINSGSKVTVTTQNLAQSRTAHATLNVDGPSKITLIYDVSYYEPELISGANDLAFDPTVENNWTIQTKDSKPVYSVTHNGVEIPYNYGNYSIEDVANGDIIDVVITPEANPATVNIVGAPGKTDIIGGVAINGEWIDDFTSSINAVTGDVLTIYPNNLCYSYFTVAVNGAEPESIWGAYETFVNAEVMNIVINGEAQPTNNVTLRLDDAAAVTVFSNSYNGFRLNGLVTGDNIIKIANYTSLDINANDGYMLSSVQRIANGATTDLNIYSMVNATAYYSMEYGNCTYDVKTADLNAQRTATATVTVDDPAKVQFHMAIGTYELVAGTNTIHFMPVEESQVTVSPARYDLELYKVSLNGQALTPNYGSYSFTMADGDAIDIQANFPEGSGHVSFTYTNPEGMGFVTDVKLNDVSVDNFNQGFDANIGDKVTVVGSYGDYNLDSICINGENVTNSFYGQYEYIVKGDTEFVIDAHPYATISATLVIDKAANVSVYYYNDNYNREYFTLVNGANPITINERFNPIVISPNRGAELKEVSDGQISYDIYQSWDGVMCQVNVTDGMTLTITTLGEEPRVADLDVLVYTSKGPFNYISIQDAKGSNEIFGQYQFDDNDSGHYTECKFAAVDNPVTLRAGLSVESTPYAYLNGQLVASQSEYYVETSCTLAEGDVVKFYAFEPLKGNITFDVQDGIEVVALADGVNAISDLSAQTQLLEGTLVKITTSDPEAVVTANDVQMPLAEGNAYAYIADGADCVIKVSKPQGLGALTTDKQVCNVYNLQGVLVIKDATAAQISQLPAGLYIVGGKKLIVK